MLELSEHRLLTQVVRRINPQAALLRVWPLQGGVSAQVLAFEIALPDGQTQKLVLRQHGETDLQQNPHIASHEFRLLQLLRSAGLAVPSRHYLDPSGEIFPTPYLVVEYVEGETSFAPADVDNTLQQMADYLAKIHGMNGSRADLSFLRKQDASVAMRLGNRPSMVDDTLYEARIRNTLEAAWPLAQRNQSVLLHGDFWPGNVLWKNGNLAAVVDWEDACIGDPLADLANSRLEILWAFDLKGDDSAMQRFTEHYLSLTQIDTTDLPFWDLYAALHPIPNIGNWGLDDDTLQAMRQQLKWFTEQAFENLSRRTA